jgi:hypothetical protein
MCRSVLLCLMRSETQLYEMQLQIHCEQSVVVNLANDCIFLDHLSVTLYLHRYAKFSDMLSVLKKLPMQPLLRYLIACLLETMPYFNLN